jgi:ribonuclease E
MQQQREHLVDAVSAERREIEEEVMRSVPRRRRGARERSGRELSAGQEGETKKKEEVPTDPRAIWKAFNTALHSEDFKKASCGAEGRQRGREGKGREHRREGVE